MERYWVAKHMRGTTLVASHSLLSWPQRPQLLQVGLDLVGEKRAAGSVSTILVSFIAVNSAKFLRLWVREPSGFVFNHTAARMSTIYDPGSGKWLFLPMAAPTGHGPEILVKTTLAAGV